MKNAFKFLKTYLGWLVLTLCLTLRFVQGVGPAVAGLKGDERPRPGSSGRAPHFPIGATEHEHEQQRAATGHCQKAPQFLPENFVS